MKWTAPENMRAWSGRWVAAGPVLMLLAVLFLMAAEFRFHWVERAVGGYLVQTNARRPESGHIWDIDHKARKAKQAVEQIVSERLSVQREALEAESMTEIARRIDPGQGAMMSPDHFRNLYLRLPPTISHKLMSPMEMLTLFSGGRWVRTYCERTERTLIVYLLGADNRVLRGMEIALQYLEQIDADAAPFDGPLEDIPELRDRTIGAGCFLETLEDLSADVRAGILADPFMLLKLPGRLTRVGFPVEIADDPVMIGFEFEVEGRRRVLRQKALRWAVLRLIAVIGASAWESAAGDEDSLTRSGP